MIKIKYDLTIIISEAKLLDILFISNSLAVSVPDMFSFLHVKFWYDSVNMLQVWNWQLYIIIGVHDWNKCLHIWNFCALLWAFHKFVHCFCDAAQY